MHLPSASDRPYLVAFSTHPELGARSIKKLRALFSNMEGVWRAPEKSLVQSGLTERVTQAVLQVRRTVNPGELMQLLRRLDIGVSVQGDISFPRLLRELPDAPAVLFCKGRISADEPAIAVVGSRKSTPYGRAVTEELVPALVQSGVAIVSGLALGIDSLAHRATLAAGGRTIAVLGSGLDRLTPQANARLAEEIIQRGGAVLSEFPLGTPSYPSNFPIRNRIIAGLALGTLIIEAALDSGSLLTAQAALEYNREVFAIPGDIFRETSQGTNNLIKMGAKVVTAAEDILVELALPARKRVVAARQVVADTPEEALLIPHLSREPRHVDALAKSSKIGIEQVGATLVLMEMKGKVRNVGGNQYVRMSS